VQTLEKKVESLVKFLENERRLRHEFEQVARSSESREAEFQQKIGAIREQAEELSFKEQMMLQELKTLKEENYHLKEEKRELEMRGRDLEAKVNNQVGRIGTLEKQNVGLFKENKDLSASKAQIERVVHT